MAKTRRTLSPSQYRVSTRAGIVLLRLTLGWMMFYAGITKVLNPEWTSANFLSKAASFQDFFLWFTQPGILPVTDLLNQWGLTLIGAALLLGLLVRVSSVLGILLMLLYYLPLPLLYPDANSFVIDSHLIYAAGFVLLAGVNAGRFFGLDALLREKKFIKNNRSLRILVG